MMGTWSGYPILALSACKFLKCTYTDYKGVMHTHTHARTHAHTHHARTHTHTDRHTHRHTHIHACTQARTHARAHTHTHTNSYLRAMGLKIKFLKREWIPRKI